MLLGQPVQPERLVGTREVRGDLLGDCQVGLGMAAADVLGIAALLEAVRSEHAHRRQQPEPGPETRRSRLHEAVVHQRREPSRTSTPSSSGGPATRLGLGHAEAAGEDRQPLEQPPFGIAQEVVAPGDRGLQRPLPLRCVA